MRPPASAARGAPDRAAGAAGPRPARKPRAAPGARPLAAQSARQPEDLLTLLPEHFAEADFRERFRAEADRDSRASRHLDRLSRSRSFRPARRHPSTWRRCRGPAAREAQRDPQRRLLVLSELGGRTGARPEAAPVAFGALFDLIFAQIRDRQDLRRVPATDGHARRRPPCCASCCATARCSRSSPMPGSSLAPRSSWFSPRQRSSRTVAGSPTSRSRATNRCCA
jgi:hypothetical protein